MMRILTVHGWAFCPQIFKNLPSNYEIEHYSIIYKGSIEDEAERLAEKVDSSTILVGWSLGATISIWASLKKTPKGLILIGATPHFGKAWKKSYIEKFLKELEENFEGKIEKFRKQVAGENLCKELKLDKERTVKLLKEFIERDFSKAFKSVEIPTLILQGKKDIIVPPREVKKLIKLNPRFELITYDGGHFPIEYKERDWEEIFSRFQKL
jgi:pimeloyl-ACP methyl ester carboxylesterase